MLKNYEVSVEINNNLHWPYIPDHPHRILIIGGSGLLKTIVLLNLQNINSQNVLIHLRSIQIKVSVIFQ